MSDRRPTLIFDGECSICSDWVKYWEALTGDSVRYHAYQEVAKDYPSIPLEAFRRAIQFVDSDGAIYSGAAATFRALRYAPGRRGWWWLYSRIPGFGPATEWAYQFFALRRGLLSRLTSLLWGRSLRPPSYDLVTWTFLRGLGTIYFTAFASLSVQIAGLVGSAGVLPLEPYLQAIQEHFGNAAYRIVPTLFWLNASDGVLVGGTIAGMLLAALVVIGRATRPALIGLFALYLSYTYAGQYFTSFQWDLLLLEAGFLAIFVTGGSRIVVWLYRWLVVRYLFMAGAAKLVSGDPTWRGLTALDYHFETQPLPTPLAWYAANLPHWILAACTAMTLFVEIGVVFLAFAPRRLRAAAAWCAIGFQLLIALTGNYNFFNLLTILICLFLFDDMALRRVLPGGLVARILAKTPRAARTATVLATALALIVVPVGVSRVWQLLTGNSLAVIDLMTEAVSPLLIVNTYGLFAVMTTQRPEVVIEGSDDGHDWREYEFRFKPGDVSRRPRWNIPHQPRLDWQMWFAALSDAQHQRWFGSFLLRLLENSPPVLALLASNPFPDHPPRYVRATRYLYRFAGAQERTATGHWWVREREGSFFPAIALADFDHARANR